MSDELERRADDLSRDDNLDLEDVRFVLAAATPEQRADAASALLAARAAALEPAARRYLDAIAAKGANGADAAAPNRLLLAPAPRGRAKDLYYPRTDVVALQEALTRLGERLAVDGDYGPATARAVASTQTRLGLSATGTVDSNTLLALNGALAAAGLATLDLTPRARIRPDWVLACRGAAASEDALTLRVALRCLATHFNDETLTVEASGAFDAALESAIRHLQAQAYLPETGIVDLSTLDALNAALLAAGQAAVQLAAPRAPAAGPIELHFYPGEHELEVYVLRGGALLDSYAMVGGRAEAKPDPNNPVVSYDPTPAGRYEVIGLSPHASGSWAYSYVPYGSELREQDGEIAFRDGSGVWRLATGQKSVFAGRVVAPLERSAYLDADGAVMKVWRANDFGHIRGLLRSLATGQMQTHMIHATPSNEATEAYFVDTAPLRDAETALAVLRYSHGCEHIHPKDLDEMISRGYLAPGTVFVVHGYDETFSPGASPS